MYPDSVYYWKPRSVTTIRRGMSAANIMTAGRGSVPKEQRKHETLTITEWGMVISYMVDSYHTHYAMVYNYRLWRGRSYGGVGGRVAMKGRAARWAELVARQAAELEGLKVPPTDAELRTHNAELLLTLRAMVDLVHDLEPALQRIGIEWGDVRSYPPALRKARKLTGRSWR